MMPGMAQALGKALLLAPAPAPAWEMGVPRKINPMGAARCLSPRCPISAEACGAALIPQVRAFQVLFLIWQCQQEKLGSVCSSPVSPL